MEVGSVLLDTEVQRRTELFGYPTVRPMEQAFFHKAVILLHECGQDGSWRGLILNRPSAIRVDGCPPWWFGGPCHTGGLFGIQYDVADDGALEQLGGDREVPSERQVTCLHALGPDLGSSSRAVLPGLWALPLSDARQELERAEVDLTQLFPIVGCTSWRPGQLEAELQRGSWALVAADARKVLDATVRTLTPVSAPATAEQLDGVRAWETLMRDIGRDSADVLKRGTTSDGRLAEWLRTRMLPPTTRWW